MKRYWVFMKYGNVSQGLDHFGSKKEAWDFVRGIKFMEEVGDLSQPVDCPPEEWPEYEVRAVDYSKADVFEHQLRMAVEGRLF